MVEIVKHNINPVPPFVNFKIGKSKSYSYSDKIESFEFIDSIDSASVFQLKVLEPEFDFDLLDEEIEISFGWTGNPVSSKKKFKFIAYDLSIPGNSSKLNFIGQDYSILIARGSNNFVYSNKTISQIVAEIAARNGLQSEIDDTDGIYTLHQVWCSDCSFIRQELIPRAISAKTGAGEYNLYFDDSGKLHFHPPRYNDKIFRNYAYQVSSFENTIRNINFFWRGEESNLSGGNSVFSFGYDGITKQEFTFVSDNNTTPEKQLLGNKTLKLTQGKNSSQPGKFSYLTQSTDENSVSLESKAIYYSAGKNRYSGIIEIDGDPLISAGNLISLNFSTEKRFLNSHSGTYLVRSVRHVITAKTYTTFLSFSAHGILAGQETLQGSFRKTLQASPSGIVEKQSSNLG